MPDFNLSPLNSALVNSISPSANTRAPEAGETGEASFADILSQSLEMVQETGEESRAATLDLLSGNVNDLSTVLIATEKASVALSLTLAIRNKAVDAYKEIMNMQI